MSSRDWQLLGRLGEGGGVPLRPEEVTLSRVLDASRIVNEAALIASVTGSIISVHETSGTDLLPISMSGSSSWLLTGPGRTGELPRPVAEKFQELHREMALEALAAKRKIQKTLWQGICHLQASPITLSYRNRKHITGIAVASVVERVDSAEKLAGRMGLPETAAREMLRWTVPCAWQPREIIRSIGALTDHLSHEVTAIYSLYYATAHCHQAEVCLRQEKQKLEDILRSLGAALIVHDKRLKVTWLNDVAEQWFGPRSELIGKRCVAGRKCEQPACDAIFKTGVRQTAEFSAQRRDGELRHYRVTSNPVRDASGSICQVLELIEDITEEVRARGQSENYRKLFHNIDDFAILADAEGKLLTVNRKVTEKLGYSEEELIGENVLRLVLEVDRDAAIEITKQAFANEIARGEVRLVSKAGRIFETELLLTYSSSDRLLQGIFRDISARRAMERELEERTRQLEEEHRKLIEATNEKERFFASVSHELRTPMTSIIGFTELLLEDSEDPLTPSQRKQIEKVSQNAHRMLMLVNDLLDLSRIKAGRMTVILDEVNIADLVSAVVTEMGPLLRGKPVELLVDLAPDLPIIQSDEQKLTQILVNLIANAIKFTDKGRITVSARRNGAGVQIAVSDTGVGIAPEDLERIFGEFQQAANVGAARRLGSGLGLTIARRLTELLKGNLTVASELGKGSVFTLFVPLAFDETQGQHAVPSVPGTPRSKLPL